MKRFLPIFAIVIALFFFVFSPTDAHAQQLEAPTAPVVPTGGLWVVDPEVTFIGKNAARSGNMLDWTLQNYNWVCVTKVAERQCDNSNNPLAQFWSLIVLYIVVPLLFFVILATAIVIIITRGRSLTIMRFIPRFVAVVLLIVFSYSILQFFYQITDLIQGFFLRSAENPCPPDCISQKDLLYVGWDYRAFIGLRLLGDYNAESAFISLLLTKLTALTYFVMVGILLMRKIILWFFIIVSPIFPILLLYYPTRNTGKIWIGEFFRWLLYAPLFAIFLKGLVYMWRNQIPLVFDNPNVGNAGQIIYPTAVNILLGGPRQFVTPTNSVNLTETFALYVVALIMLWVVILLPWILLQIFLDYASTFSPGDSAVMKTLVNMAANKQPPGGGGGPSPAPQPGGVTLNLPFAKKFKMPTTIAPTYKPGGAAKEVIRETGTAKTIEFTQPVTTPISTANMQVANLASISVPSIRDIAKYETAMLSKDSSRQQEMSQVRETLEKIANPVAVTSTIEKERYTSLREKIVQESQKGNMVATSILNAAKNVSSQSAKTSSQEMRSVLKQIANPASVTNTVDREKLTKLHDELSKESKEKNNKLASSLLSVSDSTSTKELEKIHDQLMQTKDTQLSSAILSTISSATKQKESTTQVKNVLQQISNPASATSPVEREKLTKLKESLSKASKEGNELATTILSVTDKTSVADMEKLQERIMKEKEKGVSFARDIDTMAKVETALPAQNRVQQVKQEDYQAVRDMWKENYRNMQVPEGMAATRTEWVKDDIAKIDNIVGLLSSTDSEKVSAGMDEVADILPFLLVGGFSQTEILSYLKAKQDAAKEVVTALASEEETKVTVEVKKAAEAERTMAASMDTGSSDEEEESPINTITQQTTTYSTPQISNEILTMVNLRVPKMLDIAKYETMALSRDKTKLVEVQKANEVLEKIANPAKIADVADRKHYEELREKLLARSKEGDATANSVLSAAVSASTKAPAEVAQVSDMKTALQQIANPESAKSESDKKRVSELHDKLTKASQEGNALAASILSVKADTPIEDVEKLRDQLKNEKEKGEAIATTVLSHVDESVALPSNNRIQQVSHEEYDEVRKMWEENYRNLPVPAGFNDTVAGRIEWITADGVQIQETIDLLQSPELEKRNEGLKKVAGVLPFLVLGGFSQQEMVEYLKTKLEAGKTVIEELKKEEGTKVTVTAGEQSQEQSKTMTAEIPSEEKKEEAEK